MGYSYKAILNKNKRENKSGKHAIFIRVTVDRKSKYFNLGERVDGRYWAGKENRWIKENHPFAFELNAIIKKKIDLLHKYEYRQKLFGNGISLESIAKHFHKKADLVFPDAISEQKYNSKLKDLASLAGIAKNLMNESARHSAIQFWESQGLETQHMAKMAGHAPFELALL